jgi:polar amino acid transport system substrate-binding protein
MKKVLSLLLVLAVGSLGLSACGNKTNTNKVYKIGVDSSFAPFEFQNAEGKYVGIDLDIFDAIAKLEGFEYEMSFPGFEAAKNNTLGRQVDGCMCGMSITEDRKNVFDFSDA